MIYDTITSFAKEICSFLEQNKMFPILSLKERIVYSFIEEDEEDIGERIIISFAGSHSHGEINISKDHINNYADVYIKQFFWNKDISNILFKNELDTKNAERIASYIKAIDISHIL